MSDAEIYIPDPDLVGIRYEVSRLKSIWNPSRSKWKPRRKRAIKL